MSISLSTALVQYVANGGDLARVQRIAARAQALATATLTNYVNRLTGWQHQVESDLESFHTRHFPPTHRAIKALREERTAVMDVLSAMRSVQPTGPRLHIKAPVAVKTATPPTVQTVTTPTVTPAVTTPATTYKNLVGWCKRTARPKSHDARPDIKLSSFDELKEWHENMELAAHMAGNYHGE